VMEFKCYDRGCRYCILSKGICEAYEKNRDDTNFIMSFNVDDFGDFYCEEKIPAPEPYIEDYDLSNEIGINV